jgi:hypothetical protein
MRSHARWLQALKDKLYVSSLIRKRAVKNYLSNTKVIETIINATTCMAAPSLFRSGVEALEAIQSRPELLGENQPEVTDWISCYTALSLIANRFTKAHRDNGGSAAALDFLLAGGEYSGGRLLVETVGAELEYNPGTGVLLAGSLLTHEVPEWENGERVCMSHYMKDKVHNRASVAMPRFTSHASFI